MIAKRSKYLPLSVEVLVFGDNQGHLVFRKCVLHSLRVKVRQLKTAMSFHLYGCVQFERPAFKTHFAINKNQYNL